MALSFHAQESQQRPSRDLGQGLSSSDSESCRWLLQLGSATHSLKEQVLKRTA